MIDFQILDFLFLDTRVSKKGVSNVLRTPLQRSFSNGGKCYLLYGIVLKFCIAFLSFFIPCFCHAKSVFRWPMARPLVVDNGAILSTHRIVPKPHSHAVARTCVQSPANNCMFLIPRALTCFDCNAIYLKKYLDIINIICTFATDVLK